MDIGLYQKYLQEYVQEAINYSDGSKAGIAEYLHTKRISGVLVLHKEEKKRALMDATHAFDEHRHWPLDIVISHLGVDVTIK